MSYSIIDIEGIGPAYAKKMKVAGVRTTGALLKRTASPKGRKELAQETGINERMILKWANMSDLMRIKGVGEEYSELLEAAGVDTVKELKQRRADNLAKAMAAANDKKKMVRVVPGEKRTASWIAQAKKLPSVLTY